MKAGMLRASRLPSPYQAASAVDRNSSVSEPPTTTRSGFVVRHGVAASAGPRKPPSTANTSMSSPKVTQSSSAEAVFAGL